MSQKVVVDLARAYEGSTRGMIERVVAHDGRSRLSVMWLTEHELEAGEWLTTTFDDVETVVVGSSFESTVERALRRLLDDESNRSVTSWIVYSLTFSAFEKRISGDENRRIEFRPFPKRHSIAGHAGNNVVGWPAGVSIELDDAFRLLEGILSDGKPMLKSELGNRLRMADPAFDRRTNEVAAKYQNLPARLMNEAEARGLIKVSGDREYQSVRWIGTPRATTHVALRPMRVERPDLSRRPSEDRLSSWFQRVARETTGLHPSMRDKTLGTVHTVWAGSTESDEPCTVGGAVRVAIHGEPSADESESVDGGRTNGVAMDFKGGKSYPWRKLEGFLLRMLLRAGLVVEDEGQVAEHDPWSIQQARFVPMTVELTVEELRRRVDMEIVLSIIDHCEVSWESAPDLSGAIYLDRSPGCIDRVDAVLARLHRDRRISIDPSSGMFVVGTA